MSGVSLKQLAADISNLRGMAEILAEHLGAIAAGIDRAKEQDGLRSPTQATMAEMINRRLLESHAKATFLLRDIALHFRPGEDGAYPLMTDELWAKIEGKFEALQEAPEQSTAAFEEQDCPCPDCNKDRAEAAAKTETPSATDASTAPGERVKVDMIEVRI